LRELDVSSNADVTSRGWSHLAMAIASSSVLRSLSVAHANVGDAAASALCAAVAASATLQAVDLEKTGITNRSALVIMDLVQTFPLTLTSLRLNENAISEQLRMCIYACLKSATPPADEDCNEVSSSSSELVESMENTSISAAISRMDM
ncbi:PREDICTED: leucine-rich repeat-containing protein 73-like, partial [Priapulus caudatus]|uniref:Leucine-rich repeat-containing protein 73-like n=1 Tax=Priapulus caudatus TaxID=37621 RepID=A0ABM1EX45_PRICU